MVKNMKQVAQARTQQLRLVGPATGKKFQFPPEVERRMENLKEVAKGTPTRNYLAEVKARAEKLAPTAGNGSDGKKLTGEQVEQNLLGHDRWVAKTLFELKPNPDRSDWM